MDIQSNRRLAWSLIFCGIPHLAGMDYEKKVGKLKAYYLTIYEHRDDCQRQKMDVDLLSVRYMYIKIQHSG